MNIAIKNIKAINRCQEDQLVHPDRLVQPVKMESWDQVFLEYLEQSLIVMQQIHRFIAHS